MTLQQLNYLVTVADCGNITEAAEKLFITQPSLSAAIHNLEKEMGVTAYYYVNYMQIMEEDYAYFRLFFFG